MLMCCENYLNLIGQDTTPSTNDFEESLLQDEIDYGLYVRRKLRFSWNKMEPG